jgi:hypothetical protein
MSAAKLWLDARKRLLAGSVTANRRLYNLDCVSAQQTPEYVHDGQRVLV